MDENYGAVELSKHHHDASEGEYLFKYLILVQIFMYLEAGAVPSLLQQFTFTFHLSPQEQGLLGAIVYIAISSASPWCSTLFRRFSPRSLLGWTLVINNLAVLVFACTPTGHWISKPILIIMRGFVGVTQAFHCVYSPLWVHEYAPKSQRGSWMSYLQAATPLGITLGYLAGSVTLWFAARGSEALSVVGSTNFRRLASIVLPVVYDASTIAPTAMDKAGLDHLFDDVGEGSTSLCHGIYCWRWPFFLQFLLILPLSIGIFFVPMDHITLHRPRSRSMILMESINEDVDDDDDDGNKDFEKPHELTRLRGPGPVESKRDALKWENLRLLFQERVYVCIVLGLSALFYVVAGVQYWTTLYLATNTDDSVYEIHISYLLVSGTGPILGVFFGGWLIDQFGGYAGPVQQLKALRISMILGGMGCLASLPVSYFHDTLYIAIFLWLMLFCGGSILPACSGIVISSAPHRLRPLASSVAYASYNLLGYAASNYIPGLIMNFIVRHVDTASCDTACTYRIGFRIVLMWSVWAFFCLFCGYVSSARKLAREFSKGQADV